MARFGLERGLFTDLFRAIRSYDHSIDQLSHGGGNKVLVVVRVALRGRRPEFRVRTVRNLAKRALVPLGRAESFAYVVAYECCLQAR